MGDKKLKLGSMFVGLSSAAINPGESRKVMCRPQVIFRPRHLVLPRPYPSLRLLDFKVGKNSQLVTGDAVPLNTFLFPPRAEEVLGQLVGRDWKEIGGAAGELLEELRKFYGNLGKCDTCQVGMELEFLLDNVGQEPILFQGASVYGETALGYLADAPPFGEGLSVID